MNLGSLGNIRIAVTKLLAMVRNQQIETAQYEKRINALETEVRDLRIMVLHLNKVPQTKISELAGLSKGRVSQIIKNYTEQTFGKGTTNETK